MDQDIQIVKCSECRDAVPADNIESQIQHMMVCHGMKDRGEALDSAVEHFARMFLN
jgi:hypothetical protein